MSSFSEWYEQTLSLPNRPAITYRKCSTPERVDQRTRCCVCNKWIGKTRPRDYYVDNRGVRHSRCWCRYCGVEFDKGTTPEDAQLFSIFDIETNRKLAEFKPHYEAFQKALDGTGFDITGIYTNLPSYKQEEYMEKYMDDIADSKKWYET